ncbi:MAG: class I SAM-dependent methyltransferase [Parvibaculaceae bacterium]
MRRFLIDEDGMDRAGCYALGYSQDEFKRLEVQGAFIRDLTEDLLRRAGIEPGMHVLDIGCGVGDVSLMAAELVGPAGSVVGVDRSSRAIAMAEGRTMEAGQCHRIRFTATDLATYWPDETFDAVIGRLILMYLPNPATILRRLCDHVRPGGIVVFQELATAAGSAPETPLLHQCKYWITETLERAGVETDMGPKLYATFLAAGLPAPKMICSGRVEGGGQSPVYDYLAETVRSLLPVMERLGVACAASVGVDTLAERLREEALAHTACVMLPPPLIGAWTRIPEPRHRLEDRAAAGPVAGTTPAAAFFWS